MKYAFLRSLYLILALINLPVPLIACMDDSKEFDIFEDNLKSDLEVSQELTHLIQLFNNLSPEEIEKLEEQNTILEDDMEKRGLDHSNLNQCLRWAEEEAQKEIEKRAKKKTKKGTQL